MKKNTLLIGLLLVSGTLAAQDWPTVQTEARPGSRWWWMGNTVDIPNLTYNIDEYANLYSIAIPDTFPSSRWSSGRR